MSGPKIGIVGPCAAGKSTLASALSERGYQAKQIVQEHSYVPQMWRIVGKPDFLIYLDASFATCNQRKKLDWTQTEYELELARLADAREYCDYYLQTDGLDGAQVLERALNELRNHGLASSPPTDTHSPEP